MSPSATPIMRLTRFGARDFRSLRDVEMTDLPPVVLLSGENDTGKSNLIQAVGVWLRIAQALAGAAPKGLGQRDLTHLDLYEMHEPDWSDDAPPDRPGPRDVLGNDPAALFRYGGDRFELDAELLIRVASQERRYRFEFRVERAHGGALNCIVLTAAWPDGRKDTPVELTGDAELLHRVLKNPWQQVAAERRFEDERLSLLPDPESISGLNPSGRQIKLALFRAANSLDAEQRRLFRQRLVPWLAGRPFHLPEPVPAVGPDGGLQLLIGDRPVEHRGSGPQQWVLMAGLLAMSEAAVAGLEEPEAHLSFEMQERVAESLRAWVQDPSCPPHQLFVSTHSETMTDLCTDDTTTYFKTTTLDSATVIERSRDLNELRARFGQAPIADSEALGQHGACFERPPSGESRPRRLVAANWVRLSDDAVAHLKAVPGDKLFEVRKSDGSLRLVTADWMDEYLAGNPGSGADGKHDPQ